MNQITNYFSIPVYIGKIIDPALAKVQSEISNAIDDLKSKNKFEKKPGWDPFTHNLSDTTFTTDFISEYRLENLLNEIANHVFTYMNMVNTPQQKIRKFLITGSWVTQTMKNEYAHVHTHGCHDISGVYYFKTNGEDGNLFFKTPVPQVAMSYVFGHLPTDVQFQPEVGAIVLFPSWLEHSTRANLTDNERISVSFNISFARHFADE